MKILMVTPYFWPKIGGLERYAYEIARRLTARGNEVHVITSGTERATTTMDGLMIHYVKASFTVSNTPVNPAWLWQMRRIIVQVRPDVINVHAPVPSLALVALAAAGKTALVTTYHAGSMKKGLAVPDALIAVYERIFLPLLLWRSTAIIPASEFVARGLLAPWASKSVVITPGVDTKAFAPALTKRAHGRITFIGDFRDPRKGLKYLLEAMTGLPTAHLRVIGAGTADGQQARVSYMGELRGAALISELQSSTILVLPSTTDAESFGMVLIEAMACGLTVIATTAGGAKYVVKDGQTGYLVAPADADELRRVLVSLLNDPVRVRKFGVTGRQTALTYDWDTRAEATEQVLMQSSQRKSRVKTEVIHG